mmetsp:Transcript_22339/g.25133  ORF Transcript_22339/g.25133 Transcript_22339/m.25133 type:complete len:1163 (+) Transcript_22339:66-3554(+)
MSYPHELYDTNAQQQRVKVVAGYAIQQRLGSGSFATVYKGIRISTQQQVISTEQHQHQHQHQQQKQQRESKSNMCDDDDEHNTTTAAGYLSPSKHQDQQQTKDVHDKEQLDNGKPSEVAIKAISRISEKLTKKVLQNLEIEISILRTYRHPNIVCMHDCQKTDRHFYLILEYCDGGDVQHLIRSRQKGRLTERLTRRLMRDLSSGLRFLWGQELIHRDIKPQNLLLTGPLPLEELTDNPPSTTKATATNKYNDNNSNSNSNNNNNYGFSLKIADFGFARHLQTASLAETLCGSPLYMAPEILQHHRYDAKADLWSVGTVLFEMIAGRPPFNGENHIDLLRNIQRKAVRLPPDVRVSKACVNLLRLLLNRNPISRAGFKEFFEACDIFVALGCGGTPTGPEEGGVGAYLNNSSVNSNRTTTKDLGTIHENDHGTSTAANNSSSDSLMTVVTATEQNQQQQEPQSMQQPVNTTITKSMNAISTTQQGNSHKHQQQFQQQLQSPTNSNNIVSPNLKPLVTPVTLIPNSINLYNNPPSRQQQSFQQQQQPQSTMIHNRLSPLTSSPPSMGPIFCTPQSNNSGRVPPQLHPSSTMVTNNNNSNDNTGSTTHPNRKQQDWQQQQQQQQQQPSSLSNYNSGGGMMTTTGITNVNSVVSQSQASVNDDSGFVMVERNDMTSPNSSQHYYFTASSQQQQKHQSIGQQCPPQVSKGMLSTSPGTGMMLLGIVGFGVGNNKNAITPSLRSPTPSQPTSSSNQQLQFEQQRAAIRLTDAIAATNKMIATAEDVGRRAVSVAHLGDSRAYLGMRLLFRTNEEGSSLLSATPMEGVEEESEDLCCGSTNSESYSSTCADIRDFQTHNSNSTDMMAPSTRRRSSSTVSDSNNNRKQQMVTTEEYDKDEMPFAISPIVNNMVTSNIPSRSNPSVYNRSTSMSRSMKKLSSIKVNPQMICSRFKEALSCYLKSLNMLKGAVGAAQRVTKDLKEIETQKLGQHNQTTTECDIQNMKYRCEVTSNWLCSQFRGVLERADAANIEISKLDKEQQLGQEQTSINVTSVEELIYNHSLSSGRDGAVKHLLGQYEAARSCYRSAGLLAETLLMEVNIGPEDRKILEGYVDGFACRITELDQLMVHQSRMTLSSNTVPSSRRGSGVVGVIGPPPEAPTAFTTGSPR